MTEPADNGQASHMLADLLQRSHLMLPVDLAAHLADATRSLGVSGVQVYLADVEVQYLRAMPDSSGRTPPPLLIDATLAGRAFQSITIQRAGNEESTGPARIWIPIVDGTERLGVMELSVADRDRAEQITLEHCRMLGSLTGLVIASKSAFSDSYAAIRRSRTMAVQAEMVWAFMAPRTYATQRVLLAATLEPAYEVGGDAFDHSHLGDRLQVSLFDSVGHDLTAGLISSVAMASCRTSRRSGGDLTEIAARADRAISEQFGASRFATALLCDLDTTTGEFTWLPCGHPPPLLIREGKVVKELTRPPRLPLGLIEDPGDVENPTPSYVSTEHLQPGDRLLLYTDGVIEGRAADGQEFGLARLSDFVIRNSAEGLPAPETLRRLNRAIIEYQAGPLRDDATVILLEWIPDDPEHRLTV